MIALLLLTSCRDPEVAPSELDELSRWFYTRWEDPDALAQGLGNLSSWVGAEADLDGRWSDRAYLISSLTRQDVEGLVEHDRDPAAAWGMGVLYLSDQSVEDYISEVFLLTDQTPVEPASPHHYERTFPEGGEGCFADGECETLSSMNDILREVLFYELPYWMGKAWRRVETEAGVAVCGRSWNLDETDPDSSVVLRQGYSIDLFLPIDRGLLRYQVSWGETEIPGFDDEALQGTIAEGMDDLFKAQDEYLAEQ